MTATPEALDMATVAARAASAKLGENISVIDVSDQLVITDYFVIASASNDRQVNAIVDDDAHQGIASIDQHCSVHATAVLFESPPQQPAALKANSGATAAQSFFWLMCHGALLGAFWVWFIQ